MLSHELNWRVAIVVCGRFHYEHYVHHLDARKRLDYVLFSHRLSSFSKVQSRKNAFLKEYALGVHLKFLGERMLRRGLDAYHALWRIQAASLFRPGEVNLFMLHGNCLPLIHTAKRAGKFVVGEVVNMHPAFQHELLSRAGRDARQKSGARIAVSENIDEEARLVDLLLAPSAAVANSFQSAGIPSSRIRVLPYGGPRQEIRKELAFPRSDCREPRILCVGQIMLRKGQLYLARALAASRELSSAKLTLIGRADPDYLQQVLAVFPSLEHKPHLSHNDVLQEMSRSDVLVVPSVEDGFGMVTTEALSVGLAVAVSKYAGSAEIVSRHGGGVTFDPFDHADTLLAIEKALGGNFKAFRGALPSWEDYAEALESIISNALVG